MSQEMGMAQMAESTFGRVCEHGQLARKCESCELEKIYREADAKDKRIAELSTDVDAFAAALACRRNCKTCGGTGRVPGTATTFETDSDAERRDRWLMTSCRCPSCGGKPDAILAAHDAAKDKRITELWADLARANDALAKVWGDWDTVAKRIAELEAALANLITQIEVIHEDERYKSVWVLAMLHGMEYKGPNYAPELAKCSRVLLATPQGQAALNAAKVV